MKDKEPIFRPYIVCYDENKCISTCSRREMEEIVKGGNVDWIISGKKRIDPVEIEGEINDRRARKTN